MNANPRFLGLSIILLQILLMESWPQIVKTASRYMLCQANPNSVSFPPTKKQCETSEAWPPAKKISKQYHQEPSLKKQLSMNLCLYIYIYIDVLICDGLCVIIDMHWEPIMFMFTCHLISMDHNGSQIAPGCACHPASLSVYFEPSLSQGNLQKFQISTVFHGKTCAKQLELQHLGILYTRISKMSVYFIPCVVLLVLLRNCPKLLDTISCSQKNSVDPTSTSPLPRVSSGRFASWPLTALVQHQQSSHHHQTAKKHEKTPLGPFDLRCFSIFLCTHTNLNCGWSHIIWGFGWLLPKQATCDKLIRRILCAG